MADKEATWRRDHALFGEMPCKYCIFKLTNLNFEVLKIAYAKNSKGVINKFKRLGKSRKDSHVYI